MCPHPDHLHRLSQVPSFVKRKMPTGGLAMRCPGGRRTRFGVRQLAAAFLQASLLAGNRGARTRGASKLAPWESGSKLPHSKAPAAPIGRPLGRGPQKLGSLPPECATIRGCCALQVFMRFEHCSLFSGYVLGVESGAVFADSTRRQIEWRCDYATARVHEEYGVDRRRSGLPSCLRAGLVR